MTRPRRHLMTIFMPAVVREAATRSVAVHVSSLRETSIRRLGLVLALLGGVVAAVHGAGLRVQHTPSLPLGLYRTIRGTPDRGTIGMWCLPPATASVGRRLGYLAAGSCAGGVEPVGKIVLGVAGDTIRYGAAGVVLNGWTVPNTRPLPRDSRNRPLAHVPFGTYVLRAGEVWLWSPFSSASWDSRYFGPIPTAALVSLVAPVWTMPRLRQRAEGQADHADRATSPERLLGEEGQRFSSSAGRRSRVHAAWSRA